MEPRLYSCLHLITGLKCHFPSQPPRPSLQTNFHFTPFKQVKPLLPGKQLKIITAAVARQHLGRLCREQMAGKKGGRPGEEGVWAPKNLCPPP